MQTHAILKSHCLFLLLFFLPVPDSVWKGTGSLHVCHSFTLGKLSIYDFGLPLIFLLITGKVTRNN